MLLSAGAKVNAAAAKEDGKTALQFARDKGHHSVARVLKKAGARGLQGIW
jgi:ankyrin repeat protein